MTLALPPRTDYQPVLEDYERSQVLWHALVRLYTREDVDDEAFQALRTAYLLARRALNLYTNHRRYDLYGGIPAGRIC